MNLACHGIFWNRPSSIGRARRKQQQVVELSSETCLNKLVLPLQGKPWALQPSDNAKKPDLTHFQNVGGTFFDASCICRAGNVALNNAS